MLNENFGFIVSLCAAGRADARRQWFCGARGATDATKASLGAKLKRDLPLKCLLVGPSSCKPID